MNLRLALTGDWRIESSAVPLGATFRSFRLFHFGLVVRLQRKGAAELTRSL